MSLFQLGNYTLNSGVESPFKIDCDALSDDDLTCIAWLLRERLPEFSAVDGVPGGGLRLADFMRRYCHRGPGRLLIVDDVCTTGGSMERHRAGRLAIGAVIFARSRDSCPGWIMPLFVMTE